MRTRLIVSLALAVTAFAPDAPPGASAGASAGALPYRPPHPGPIVRHFEPPPTPYAAGHRGIDIAAPEGSTVIAAAGGRVAFAGPVGGAMSVSIDHADGIRTTYSFLSATLVRAGDLVERGAPIARSGTGHPGSTLPPHLHVGALRGGTYVDVEQVIVDGLRRDYSPVLRLVPPPE